MQRVQKDPSSSMADDRHDRGGECDGRSVLGGPSLALPDAQTIDRLEPHGIGVIDLVGEVPETTLHDAVIVYSNNGTLVYDSGERVGETVTIRARVIPRYGGSGADEHTLVNCLGQPALTDSWPIVSPVESMRVYENGVEITDEAWLQLLRPGGRIHPLNNPSTFRYPEGQTTEASFNDDGSIAVAVNRGCAIVFRGYRSNLTATFTVQTPKYISVKMLGSETFTFHSYIGPGATGEIGGLVTQLTRRYANRHDKFALTIPSGAEFALVTFPLTPVHPYVNEPIDLNLQQPGSGTYRIGRKNSLDLSVDHVVTMGIPLFWQTCDADQSAGREYLPTFTTPGELTSMEYFVPAGIAYDSCMRRGTCSNALIEQIYNTEMQMTIHYMVVDRINVGLDQIPLRQVGPAWSPGFSAASVGSVVASATVLDENALASPAPQPAARTKAQPSIAPTAPAGGDLYLPMVYWSEPIEVPPDDPAPCPCGWFDPDGRMVDFVPGP